MQELPAVEGLARVDVVCLDKTGTLTYGDVLFDRLVPLGDAATAAELRTALGLLTGDDEHNATARALAAAFPRPDEEPGRDGAVLLGTQVVGDPDRTRRHLGPGSTGDGAGRGRRGSAPQTPARGPTPWRHKDGGCCSWRGPTTDCPRADGEPVLPPDLVPVALVVLVERIREDAAEVLRYFTDQGVALKVISGDNPRTVGMVAATVGVPGVRGATDAVDARTLPEDPQALADVMEAHSVFGRVSPHQKRAMVSALQARGHVVAMTGDGVNDALALKDADIGVAMGNGSPATRAVAQLVLLDGRFAHLPEAVAEGRRVIANIERAANLFLVKNVYSLVLALITVVTAAAFPFAPIQLTLISAVTIGIPGFFLALGPNRRRYVPGFVRRVLRFSVPTGIVIGVVAYAGYAGTRWLAPDAGLDAARTTATIVVLVVALWTLTILARPLVAWKIGLVAAMAGIAAAAVLIPSVGQSVFLLEVTTTGSLVAAVMGVAGAALVELVHRLAPLEREGTAPRPGRGACRPGSSASPR